jgi:[lysine-biosynthesis-protein LysW]--L-2-aminoadipate ligase
LGRIAVALRMLYTRLRAEEKLLAQAAERRGIPFFLHHLGEDFWGGGAGEDLFDPGDLLLLRCIAHGENELLASHFSYLGWRTVNPREVISCCGSKGETSMLLEAVGIPQPAFRFAFSAEGALKAAEDLGYPVVFKPMTGSWGRLLAKVDTPEMAEAVIEHKMQLGGQHRNFYVQQYVEKEGFDVRAFVIGGEPRCAIRRYSEHWITNTARGGRAEVQPLERDLVDLLNRVHAAVGGEFLAVDCFATPSGWMVNEINDGGEFRNSIDITGVDIPGELLEHCASLEEDLSSDSRRGIKSIKRIKRAPRGAAAVVPYRAEEEECPLS